jgi:hypothetical protein
MSSVSEMVFMPSFRWDEAGSSIKSARTWAVSLEIEAIEIVNGDEDNDCRVCANGDVPYWMLLKNFHCCF